MSKTKAEKFASEKWTLPANLKLTKALRAQAEEQQAEWASKTASPFGSLSPAEFERSKAATSAAENERLLQAIEDAPNKEEFAESAMFLRQSLAENYAVLGRFDKSAELEHNPTRRAEYEQILRAIKRSDSAWCKCADQLGDVPVSNVFVKQNIWSVKLNKEIVLLACRECGELNAVESVPIAIAKERAARVRAHELAKDLPSAEAKAALISHNHTTKQLLSDK